MTDALRMLAERTLRWRNLSWHWGDAIAIDGLLEAGARDDVAEQIERWATRAPDGFDDVLAPGRAIVARAADGAVSPRAAEHAATMLDRLADGIVQGVSAGVLPSWDPESYRTFRCEPSPWGQGAALRAMVALARAA